VRQIYKTSFTTSPYAFIEIAARAQKWVDQALSRNIYLADREMDNIKQVYMAAWKRGLKTTYYLHMKPRHTAEQSTVSVNKAAALGKRGFASVAPAAVAMTEAPTVSPIQQSPLTVQEMVPLSPNSAPAVDVVMPAESSRGFAPAAAQGALPIIPAAQQTLPVQEAAKPVMAATTPAFAATQPRMGFATVTPTPVAPVAQAPALAPVSAPIAAAAPAKKEKPFVCPIDPAERAQCD
jgi:ribonucleoside-diphosphate reductase alpha chain